MKERPILMSAPMVRALLDGTKTQTRRIVKFQEFGCFTGDCPHELQSECDAAIQAFCPYGQRGDRLWVRETWAQNADQRSDIYMDTSLVYRADGGSRALDNGIEKPWRPSIFMPRWASRITLEITAVRAERLKDIVEKDARSEGVNDCDEPEHDDCFYGTIGYRCSFKSIWESINGPGSWSANPYVWVIEFKKL